MEPVKVDNELPTSASEVRSQSSSSHVESLRPKQRVDIGAWDGVIEAHLKLGWIVEAIEHTHGHDNIVEGMHKEHKPICIPGGNNNHELICIPGGNNNHELMNVPGDVHEEKVSRDESDLTDAEG